MTLDAVLLSHLHADHCLDVAPFVVWHRYSAQFRRPRVALYAPIGADRRLAMAYDDDGDPHTFAALGRRFLGPEVRVAEPVRAAV